MENTYIFHTIIEYGLGDFDDKEFPYQVTEEEMGMIQTAVEKKQYFDEVEELHDLYQAVFEEVYKKESEEYLEKVMYGENGEMLIEGEDFIPFDNFTLYVTF